MIFLWLVLGWWFIGFVFTILGSILFDKRVSIGGIIAAGMIGIFGPAIMVFFLITFAEQYDSVTIWERKK